MTNLTFVSFLISLVYTITDLKSIQQVYFLYTKNLDAFIIAFYFVAFNYMSFDSMRTDINSRHRFISQKVPKKDYLLSNMVHLDYMTVYRDMWYFLCTHIFILCTQVYIATITLLKSLYRENDMEENEKTSIQIEKETLVAFNKKKYKTMSEKGKNLTNDEFLKLLLESFE